MKILVTGGTGSFGNAFVKRYHKEHDITVFSRDENKQFEMRKIYPDVRFEIGDVRDRARVGEVMQGQDYAFHAAALKQVPSCEFFPFEAVKTNILGAEHVIDAATKAGVKLVCLSTDKAAYPINAMGISKAMMEKLAISKGAIVTRYGNVMKSRGSIIPIWEQNAKEGKPVNITNYEMTRFLMSLDDSIDLVMYAMEHGEAGDLFVKKAPACRMIDLAHAIIHTHAPLQKGVQYGATETIGIRHGEKMHETLITQEEMYRTEDMGDYYRVKADVRDMNYDQYFVEGQTKTDIQPFTSANTERLNVEQIKELLNGLKTA